MKARDRHFPPPRARRVRPEPQLWTRRESLVERGAWQEILERDGKVAIFEVRNGALRLVQVYQRKDAA